MNRESASAGAGDIWITSLDCNGNPERVTIKNFGVPPGAATPDDIWDFVLAESAKYVQVRALARLEESPDKCLSTMP